MSKILVTGAAGFIGSGLAYRLFKNGDEVILLDNFSYGREDNLVFPDYNFNDEILRKDIRDIEFMDKLFRDEKFDIVYHFAGITPLPDCQNNPVLSIDVNVKGTAIILDLARKYNVGSVVYASTSAVYENNRDFPSREDNVVPPSLIYPSSKYMSEQLCKAFYDAYNIPIVCLRFTNVYGPHIDCLRKQPPVMGYIIREYFYGNGPILHSDGEQERDFVYVDDLIDLAILVNKNKCFDIVNVSTGKTTSINKITKMIADKMNCGDIPIRYEDTTHYWSRYPELYQEPYPINTKLLDHEVLKYTCLSNEHAKKVYGWSPKTDLDNGISKTVDFSVKVLKRAKNE